MTKEVILTIDGKEVTVPAGTLVVDAAKKAGIDIPIFCYHPKMEPAGKSAQNQHLMLQWVQQHSFGL